jgi:hypothetical protein
MSFVVDVVSEDSFYDNLTLGVVRLLGKYIRSVICGTVLRKEALLQVTTVAWLLSQFFSSALHEVTRGSSPEVDTGDKSARRCSHVNETVLHKGNSLQVFTLLASVINVWGTRYHSCRGAMLQSGRSRLRDTVRQLNVINLPNLSSRTRP